jgi:hypothetical protein
MVRVPFIAKPLRVLKNTSGLKAELAHSTEFHKLGLPLLISQALLRSRGLGQIDLGRMIKDRDGWVVEVAEVKSQDKGILMMGHQQKQRLRYSLKFITALLGCRGKLVLLSQRDNRVD